MLHPYIRFRLRLAQHALRQFAASLKASVEIIVLGFGQVVVGLCAMVALPPMYAAAQPLPLALLLLCAHGLAMAIPMWLLRKRIFPRDTMLWLHTLPVPPRVRLAADAAVVGILAIPLALAYLVSSAIWLFEAPAWLTPTRAVAGTVFSLTLTLAASVAMLGARRPARAARWEGHPSATPTAYRPRRPRARLPFLWHRLFWLPFWRNENMVGVQQTLLLLAGLACAWVWMAPLAGVPHAVLGLATSTCLMILTDRGDKAVREQITTLQAVTPAWPAPMRLLERGARLFTLAPGALVLALLLAGGARHGLWQHRAGVVYLVTAAASMLAMVVFAKFKPEVRSGLVIGAIVMLSAIGSELWN